MSEILDIVLDIEEAGKKAQELENLASQLEKISDTELDEILTSIQNAWKGDNATAFIKKGTTLAGNINTSAGQLRRIAETIRTIAKNLQAADAQAAATASLSSETDSLFCLNGGHKGRLSAIMDASDDDKSSAGANFNPPCVPNTAAAVDIDGSSEDDG